MIAVGELWCEWDDQPSVPRVFQGVVFCATCGRTDHPTLAEQERRAAALRGE